MTGIENIFLVSSPSTITTIVILMLGILFLASIAAGAEVGFFSLKVKDINYLKTKEDTNSRLIISILEDPELLLSTLRVSKYSLSTLIVLLLTYLGAITAPDTINPFLVYIGVVIASIFILVLFVEILPKVYSRHNNVRMTSFTAPIVNILFLTFKGFGQMLVDSVEYKDQKRNRKVLEVDNLKELEGVIEASLGHAATKEEVDIFKGVLKFGSISVKQVMQPRLDVVAIRENWTATKLKEKVLEAGYSRVPVYRNNIDEIVGMIHAKDLLPFLDIDNFDWHSLIRPAYYVHQHKLIDDLLSDFRDNRVHFAIVVDEFGGTSGIITLEDIMEEIVGDIKDEFDEDEHNFRKIDDHAYIFEGRMLINDMCRIMGIPLATFAEVRGESDSVAGLVLEIAGKFPSVNEQVSLDLYDFTVLSVDKLRIEKVKVEYNI
jgi:putative hemolysin